MILFNEMLIEFKKSPGSQNVDSMIQLNITEALEAYLSNMLIRGHFSSIYL